MTAANQANQSTPGPRVLVVDDDPLIHPLVRSYLKSIRAEIITALSGDEAIERMREQLPDVVLLDFDMPVRNGLDVLKQIKDDPVLHSSQVIFMTGHVDHSLITRCFELGAADYVSKPFCRPEFIARIHTAWERRTLLTELKQAARLDGLTGLPNRSLLLARLSDMIDRTRTMHGPAFAVLYLDFDRFKVINDSLGHDAGDRLLCAISARLRENLRPTDSISRSSAETTLARLGGDEFVVLASDVPDADAAESIAARLLTALSRPYDINGQKVSSTASIGVVCSGPEYASAEQMLRDADTAMYEAKARGKGCHILFDPAMQRAVHDRHELEVSLRTAIGTDQLRLVYQPIVELDTGRLKGIEALVRWDHPTRGRVSPAIFIPIAEESRIILQLSDWIMRTACRDFMRIVNTPTAPPLDYVSINLSRVQLGEPDLVERVLSIVAEAGMPANRCQLEITESEIMHDKVAALALLRSLKSAGIRLAMDDFGTGYSSLACLHELPFDIIKIDQSFISHLTEVRREFVSLVNAISSLADNLGMPCVAEGVETQEQLAVLVSINCRYGQGYYFGPPMPLSNYLDGTWTARRAA